LPENESGQPHKLYTFSLDPVTYIQEKLGVIEGMRDFSHPYKFAQNVYDLLRTVDQFVKDGIFQVKNESEKKISLNQKAYDEFNQIWSGRTYLHLTIDKKTGQPINHEIVLNKPDIDTELEEYFMLPSLMQFVPTEDKAQNNLLVRIGADIPEKYAYEGSDVLSLDTIGGCYNIMPETYQCSVCGRRGHEAWFDSQEELESSDNISGGYVTKSFYEKFKMLLFSAIDDRWFVLKANIVKMAIEVKESGYEKHNRIRLKK